MDEKINYNMFYEATYFINKRNRTVTTVTTAAKFKIIQDMAASGSNGLGPRVSARQAEMLVEFMSEHRELVVGCIEFRPGESARDRQAL